MEHVASYLEKLGYTIEEQGSISKYLVIFKEGMPLGFLMPDFTLSLVNTTDEELLNNIISFVKENDNSEIVSGHEYLVSSYRHHKLTTYYDTQLRMPCFATYIVSTDDGTVTVQAYTDIDIAKNDFLIKSHFLSKQHLKNNKITLKKCFAQSCFNYFSK